MQKMLEFVTTTHTLFELHGYHYQNFMKSKLTRILLDSFDPTCRYGFVRSLQAINFENRNHIYKYYVYTVDERIN